MKKDIKKMLRRSRSFCRLRTCRTLVIRKATSWDGLVDRIMASNPSFFWIELNIWLMDDGFSSKYMSSSDRRVPTNLPVKENSLQTTNLTIFWTALHTEWRYFELIACGVFAQRIGLLTIEVKLFFPNNSQ
ncbi:uncharacterized protein LOC108734853 [Agrilus planipennis]|uniref:Uncharacterized protein LOC108734853 n=1 Tax=Agrilus planipennis TaxID=224129 RepID=A0A1W4WDP8_AGRPL|nr:uncharacterized protein LOC108734853 [Agrilus planipennis]